MQFQAARYNSDNNFGKYQETEPRPVSFGTDAAGQDVVDRGLDRDVPEDIVRLTWQWDGNLFGDAIDDTAEIHTLVDNNRTYVLADLPRAVAATANLTIARDGLDPVTVPFSDIRREASTARSRHTRSANRRRTRLRSSARTVRSWRLGRHREDRRRPRDHRDHRRRRRSVRRSRHQHHDPRHRRTTLDRPRGRCSAARPDGLRRSHIGVVEQRTESRASYHDRPRRLPRLNRPLRRRPCLRRWCRTTRPTHRGSTASRTFSSTTPQARSVFSTEAGPLPALGHQRVDGVAVDRDVFRRSAGRRNRRLSSFGRHAFDCHLSSDLRPVGCRVHPWRLGQREDHLVRVE